MLFVAGALAVGATLALAQNDNREEISWTEFQSKYLAMRSVSKAHLVYNVLSIVDKVSAV